MTLEIIAHMTSDLHYVCCIFEIQAMTL